MNQFCMFSCHSKEFLLKNIGCIFVCSCPPDDLGLMGPENVSFSPRKFSYACVVNRM
jgi:hypothetical protein